MMGRRRRSADKGNIIGRGDAECHWARWRLECPIRRRELSCGTAGFMAQGSGPLLGGLGGAGDTGGLFSGPADCFTG